MIAAGRNVALAALVAAAITPDYPDAMDLFQPGLVDTRRPRSEGRLYTANGLILRPVAHQSAKEMQRRQRQQARHHANKG